MYGWIYLALFAAGTLHHPASEYKGTASGYLD